MKYLIYGGGGFHPNKILIDSLNVLEDVVDEGHYTIYELKKIKEIDVVDTRTIKEVTNENPICSR